MLIAMPQESRAYRRRMLELAEELHRSGSMDRYAFAPPLFRLAWLVGLRVPPPVYLSFVTLAVSLGAFFGLTWGTCMWLVFRAAARFLAWVAGAAPRADWALLALLMAFCGILVGTWFGIAMATRYEADAKRLQLPPLDPPAAT